jgi:hypothetical protein
VLNALSTRILEKEGTSRMTDQTRLIDEKPLNERELEDDYPLHAGYLYVVKTDVWRCPYPMTVGELKKHEGFDSVKNYDIKGRNIWHLAI